MFPFPGLMSSLVRSLWAARRVGQVRVPGLAFAPDAGFIHQREPSVLVRLRMPDSTRAQMILDCDIVAIADCPVSRVIGERAM